MQEEYDRTTKIYKVVTKVTLDNTENTAPLPSTVWNHPHQRNEECFSCAIAAGFLLNQGQSLISIVFFQYYDVAWDVPAPDYEKLVRVSS